MAKARLQSEKWHRGFGWRIVGMYSQIFHNFLVGGEKNDAFSYAAGMEEDQGDWAMISYILW